ncbi:MAG: DoxX family membrane protein [Candidatus Yanofskybacteria bacterium]|nr:DoxX family membrane protein [Candidatus Yanofskybacteria bacterium]
MFTSSRYSYLALRLGLAVVFLWFGIDKMFRPAYWLNAWVPQNIQTLIAQFSVTGLQFIYLNGIFEILVGLSLITGVFAKFFSVLAILFLLSVLIFVGISEVTVRDFAMIGGFIAIVFWPNGNRRF